MLLNKSNWFVGSIFGTFLCLSACTPSPSQLVEQAEREASNQRLQVSQHLFLRVIEKYSTKDETRFRALKGLSLLAIEQMQDYVTGIKAVDLALSEFGSDESKKQALNELRLLAAEVSDVQLQNTPQAMKYLETFTPSSDLNAKDWQLIGRIRLKARSFDESMAAFDQAWKLAVSSKDCPRLAALQLDFMQFYAIQKLCAEAIEFGEKPLPHQCQSKDVEVQVELAHCYEFEGFIDRSLEIYDKLLKEYPDNSRFAFLREAIQKREREKLRK